jgi:hypothetical protein
MSRAWLAGLAGGLLALGSTGVAQAQAPDQVIDAGTNAADAAKALNDGCVDTHKCQWTSTPKTMLSDYGPERIIGDVLYNCSATDQARTAVGVTDERGDTTSLSESLSFEVSLGVLGLEKSSGELSVFSGQSQSFSTEVSVSNSVPVPPGFKGWTEASMLSTAVNGSVSITQGIHLIKVTDIDLTFPGYTARGTSGQRSPVVYSGIAEAMTADEVKTRCDALPTGTSSATARAAAQARRAKARTERFKISVCRRTGCARLAVTGPKKPPPLRAVTAKLTRAGRVYAVDNGRDGRLRLTQRRTITPGEYKLIMRKKPKNIIVRHNGKRLHRAKQHMITIVPVTIRRTR